MDFYIFRHGQTFFSKNEIPYGEQVETAEILTEGIPAIKRLAEYLKDIQTDANFTSPYKRCIQTTNIVSEITDKKFEIDFRLHDFNSETIGEMVERMKNFFEEISLRSYKSVAICTHGYPISVLKNLITEDESYIKNLGSYPKSGILTIIKMGKIETVDFN